ncbi:MAG: hypothetical protein M9954_15405 [Cyclobacteriaceae bacterium]|nr:hypothetical protein [Cyclobacteriaceae bacterium]
MQTRSGGSILTAPEAKYWWHQWPKAIALDVAGGKMYYVVLNLSTPELWRVDLDGSNQQLLHSSGTTLFLSVAWIWSMAMSIGQNRQEALRGADLDGSNLTL